MITHCIGLSHCFHWCWVSLNYCRSIYFFQHEHIFGENFMCSCLYSNNIAGASPNINVELVDHQNRTHCRRQLFLTVSHAPVSHNRVIQQRSAPGTPCKHRRGSRSCSRSPSRTYSNDSGGLQVFLAIKASTVQILLWLIYFIKDLFHKKNFMNFESISSTFSFLNSGICINFYSAFS